MKTFDKHGWNNLDETKLPANARFRLEVHQTFGDGPEMHTVIRRFVGASDNMGTLYLNNNGAVHEITEYDFGRSGHTKIKIRLWEED